MHWVRGRQVVLLLVVAMVLVACGNGDNGDEEDPPPIGGEDVDEPGTSDDSDDPDDPEASEEDDDPYAVPDEVDEDYAERVINALLEVRADVTESLFEYERGESLREEDLERLSEIYSGEQLESAIITLQRIADEPEEVEALYLPPQDLGPARFEAMELLEVEDECIVVAGYFDLSDVQQEVPYAPGEDFAVFSLSPMSSDGTDDVNETPWQLRDQLAMEDADGEPIDPEDWGDLDLGDSLDHTCEDA